jgi:hypothetical protein
VFGASLAAPSAASAGCFLLIFCTTTPTQPAPSPTPPPATNPPPAYGFNDLSWNNVALYPHNVQLYEMGQIRAKYWRTGLSWQYWEPTENNTDQYYLPNTLNEYNQMLSNGQTPVFLVMGTPYWALTSLGKGSSKGGLLCAPNNNATQCNAPPDVRDPNIMAKWQHFLQVMAYTMPKAVYEIWNEPNIDWNWMQTQDVELYGLMLKSGAEAIHAISPTTKVISGGINGYNQADTSMLTGFQSFLRQMYQVVPKQDFNGLGVHAYPCAGSSAAAWTPFVTYVLDRVRATRDAAGDTNKPMWITETGATTGKNNSSQCGGYFTEAQQGPALGATLDTIKQSNDTHHDVSAVLINSLFNLYVRNNLGGTSNNEAEGEYGIIAGVRNPLTGQISWKKKPGYTTVACKFANTC